MISKNFPATMVLYSIPILGFIPKNSWKKGLSGDPLMGIAVLILGIGGCWMITKGCQLKQKEIKSMRHKNLGRVSDRDGFYSIKKSLLIGGGIACIALGYYLAYRMSHSIESSCLPEAFTSTDKACAKYLNRIKEAIYHCPEANNFFYEMQSKARFIVTCAEDNEPTRILPEQIRLSKDQRNSLYGLMFTIIERNKKMNQGDLKERVLPYCLKGKDAAINAIQKISHDALLQIYKIYAACLSRNLWKRDEDFESVGKELGTFEQYNAFLRGDLGAMKQLMEVYRGICEGPLYV